MPRSVLVAGLDLGTGGARAVVATTQGVVVARAGGDFARAARADAFHEQDPAVWWETARGVLGEVVAHWRASPSADLPLAALAIDGTSGTLVAVDACGAPMRPALMYNDPRGAAEAEELNALAASAGRGFRCNASFAAAKALWFSRHEPIAFERSRWLLHQADFLVAQLTGEWGVSDYSNALKTGFDLEREAWPEWLLNLPGLAERLPRIVAPGQPVGRVSAIAAEATGLPRSTLVVAGCTDGTAAALASGISRAGEINTTLGTTLVFKTLAAAPCDDPLGRVYAHKLPGGFWLPGAASNVGAGWIREQFPGAELATLDGQAEGLLPTATLSYPLTQTGERFPFIHPRAEGFSMPPPANDLVRYAAGLQGVALVERLGCDLLDALCDQGGGDIFTTGGGSTSDVWLQCRADATGRVIHRPAEPDSAFGCAILAAAGATDDHAAWPAAARNMVRVAHRAEPRPARTAQYAELAGRLRAELARRGWWPAE